MVSPDLAEGNRARPVLPGLFDLPCLPEFLLWGLASNGRMEFPLGRLPLTQMAWLLQPSGPTVRSVMMMVTRPTASSLPTSSTHLVISSGTCTTSLAGEELLAGEGWCTGEGGHFSTFSFLTCLASCLLLLTSSLLSPSCLASLARQAHSLLMRSTILPSLSLVGVVFVLAMLFEK